MRGLHLKLLTGAVILGLTASSTLAEGPWLKAGPVYRGGMEADASGSSHVQQQGVHAATPMRSFPGYSDNNDDTSQYGDRTFDDGYVNMDPGTGNPASIDPTVTWYWGYENDGQYDAGSDTLNFHRTTSESGSGRIVTLTTLQDDPASFDDTFSGWGLELVGGYPLRTRGKLRVDLCAGLAGIWGAEADLGGSTFAEQIQDDRYSVRDTITDTYTYDTTGVTVPAAPHEGTYDGPFDTPPVIPSPTIPNRPSSVDRDTDRSTRRTSSTTWSARNHINMEVDTDLYELWLGPRLALQANDRLALHVTPKVSATYVDASVDRTETFVATYADGSSATLNSWSDSGSESKFVFGAGVAAGADLEFENGMFAGIWGGYEWVSEDVDVQVGPNTVAVDASGYTAGAVIGYRFGGGAPRASASLRRLSDLPVEAVSSAHTPARELRDAAAKSASVSEDDLNAPVPMRRVEVSQEAEVSAKSAAGTAETQAANGERAYNELRAIAKASKDKEMVRHALQTMKKYEPEEYAALMAYWQQRKAERTQLAMR